MAMDKDAARRIAERFSELTPDKRRLFWQKMNEQGVSPAQFPILARTRSGAPHVVASYAQQRQWFMWQLSPASSAYHVAGGLWLNGAVNASALRASVEAIVARHEVLRTRFIADEAGQVEQWIDAHAALDWQEATLAASEIDDAARALANRPFDLAQGPLLRAALYHGQEGRSLFVLAMHHIVSDGWSVRVLLEELVAHYRAAVLNEPLTLPALDVQYADYAAWQREWLDAGERDKQLVYWREALGDAQAVLALPTDAPRQAQAAYRAARHRVRLPDTLAQALKARAQATSTTPFMVLLTAFEALLHRYTGQDDIRVGVPVANRHRMETEPLIGFFVNTQVLRARIDSGTTLDALLEQTRQATLGAQAHQDVPFDALVDALRPERSLSHTPLFQVMFNHQRSDWRITESLPGLTAERYDLPDESALFELTLNIDEHADGAMDAELIYAAELFDAASIARIGGHYLNMLRALTEEPSQRIDDVALLDAAQRRQLHEWSGALEGSADAHDFVHRRFAARARATPDAPALIGDAARMTYRELNEQANRIAALLVREGIGPEGRVGLAMSRSAGLVAALLGILKAGGAYVPLDPAYPADRLAHMTTDSGIGLLLVDASSEARARQACAMPMLNLDTCALPDAHGADPDPALHAHNLAYVVYTSGSTGRPKGVAVAHGALAAHCEAIGARYGIDETDRCLHFASISFDAAAEQLLMPLTRGAAILLRDDDVWSAERLVDEIGAHGITALDLPPTYIDAFARQTAAGAVRVRTCIVGGEAWSRAGFDAVRAQLAPQRIFNAYGPSEAVITPTVWQADEAAFDGPYAPIGRCIGPRTAWVLDARKRPVPPGVPGELHLGGAGLARGYLGQPGLSASRFVPDPFSGTPGARLYCTGDLVRWRADGQLAFLGRLDEQVKVRGFRIEPGEIEARLREQTGVADAVVVALDGPNGARLAGYVTASAGHRIDRATLRAQLAATLPDYMVPGMLIVLDAMPLTPNGKIDRRALPAPEEPASSSFEAPQGEVETALAAIWAQLLKRERIGRHENFFELGGDSIMGLQIVALARRAGVGLSARQIFEQQTVAQLAAVAVSVSLDETSPATVTPIAGIDVHAPVPLLPIQAWFFSEPFPVRNHWNQAVLLNVGHTLDTGALQDALHATIAHHDALRLRFDFTDSWRQRYAAAETASPLQVVSQVPAADIEARCDALQASLDIERGPLIRALALGIDDGTWRVFIAIHHLAVDTVSWRILLDDLQHAYARRRAGEPVSLPEPTTSYQAFGRQLQEAARGAEVERAMTHWQPLADVPAALPEGSSGSPHAAGEAVRAVVQFDRAATRRLQQDACVAYRTQLVDLLLLATGRALCAFAGRDALRIDLEAHGRETPFGAADLSRTVGWFTSIYPFELAPTGEPGAALKRVKEARRAVPHDGISFGMAKYLGTPSQRASLAGIGHADVLFNYLGQFDATAHVGDGDGWRLATESGGRATGALNRATHALEIAAQIHDGALSVALLHANGDRYGHAVLDALADSVRRELLAALDHCESGASGLTPSDVPLAGVGQARLDRLPMRAADVADLYPLAPMQTGIVFHSLLGQQPGAYVNQMRVDIDGLDCARFEAAWTAAAIRHDVLRTGFLSFDDGPRQWVARSVPTPFVVEDWHAGPHAGAELDARLDRHAAALVAQGFDLTRAPLWRVDVLRTGAARHHFVWTFHHALLDGWSAARLLAEVLASYEGRSADHAPGRYRDFIAWLGTRSQAASESWWREHLSMLDGPTLLAHAVQPPRTADASRAAANGSWSLTWDAERAAAFSRFARSRRVTPNTLVQAAWLVLLQRYTGQRAVAFGATVAGRPESLPGADRTLGLFINTIPVIGLPDPSITVSAWLERVQGQGVAAREHEHVALYDIQRWAGMEGGQALFDSIIVFENYPVDDILKASGVGELRFSNLRNEDRTSYPLTLSVTQGRRQGESGADSLRIDFDYAGDTFDAAQIERMAAQLSTLLDAFVAAPDVPLGALGMLPADERAQLVRLGHAPEVPAVEPVHVRIARQASLRPDASALVLDGVALDYRTLDRRASQVAYALRAAGIGPEARVGVAIERSIAMIVAILGVLKAGAAYVPLDPSYPAERLAFMIEDSGIAVALTAPSADTSSVPVESLARLGVTTLDVNLLPPPDTQPEPDCAWSPTRLAYVIYTSGSTGRPKGVGITHDALARHTEVSIDLFGVTSRDRVLQFSTFNFDGFVEQVFPTLAVGATLILRGPELWSSERFLAEVAGERITVADLTTAYWNALAQDFAARDPHAVRNACLTLRRVHAGGEAMPADGVRAWRTAGLAHIALANTYGPSEAVVTTTSFDCAPYLQHDVDVPAQIPLGGPLDGRALRVLDAQCNAAPLGVAGELCIGGTLLARGYLGRPGLTASRFIADPLADTPGARLYRTGDIVRWNPDGTLAYLGRTDHQVKVRGFRIELGEIEASLARQPCVREAAVITRDGVGGLRVLAYAVPAEGATLDGHALRKALAASLPDYMVPAAVVVLEAMPLNPNGKIDRRALPAPVVSASADPAECPEGEMETTLAGIWSSVLEVAPVRRRDRFFELGGHSLAAMQVQSAIRAQLGIDAPLADLMRNQPLQELALALSSLQRPVADDAAMANAMRDILAQL
ncbi:MULTISPECIES: non-ribosomal peptide synthetase [unclassified Caballeronia]|uniref:non-ribosomal peptide synthetase n=1 Tax=unclassified Caballeronia TaxID=2646786 RepID=UPI00285F29FE|nr:MULTISPECIES: non-ribosomal peptide synthetase [unclassified Caballeronia]MDR5776819.1 amino acid adenylation domain-containing protein [Caballeronia sp. LZ002]MDR5798678.1 amino acid adenylation domain-containing protein [Caballeronia sp. LZ001]